MSDSSVFQFFRLPRELRDNIYKKTGGQKRSGNVRLFESSSGITSGPRSISIRQIIINNHPLESLQLVSKAFKEEYEKEVYCHSRLELVHDQSTKLPIPLSGAGVSEGLLKSISKIPELNARLMPPEGRTRDFFPQWSATNEEAIRVLLPHIPKCKRVFCDAVFRFPAWAQRSFETCACAYAKAPMIPSDLKLERRIYFAGELYHMYEGYEPDEATRRKIPIPNGDWPALREKLQKAPINNVYYRAYLEDGPNSIHGWRLEMSTPRTNSVTVEWPV